MNAFLKKKPIVASETDNVAVTAMTTATSNADSTVPQPQKPPVVNRPPHAVSQHRLSLPLPQLFSPTINKPESLKQVRSIMTQSVPTEPGTNVESQSSISPLNMKTKNMFFKPDFTKTRHSIATIQPQYMHPTTSIDSTKASLRSILQPIQSTIPIPTSSMNSTLSASMLPQQGQSLHRTFESNRSFAYSRKSSAAQQVPRLQQQQLVHLQPTSTIEDQSSSAKKNNSSIIQSKAFRSRKFQAEVQSLLDLIEPGQKQPVKPSILSSKNQNLLACFSSLISQSVLKQAEDKYSDYQHSSVLTIRKAREMLESHPILFENGSGLIIIQSSKGCSILPCFDKKISESTCYVHPIGTYFLVKEMRELIEYELQGAELQDAEVNSICKEILIKHCYFARHFPSEKADFLLSYVRWIVFKKPLDQIKDATKVFFDYTLSIQLGYSQIACTELVFTPTVSNKHRYLPSITDLINASLQSFSPRDKQTLLKNIVCTGLYPSLPGFKERLAHEIGNAIPEYAQNGSRVHVINN